MSSPVDPSSESSSTTTPVATEEPASLDLKAMISTFGPESVEPLEEAVSKQAAGTAPYELDLNLALLRLYNFYPRHYNNQIVVKILCLALMQLPENHFVLTLSAVSPTRQSEDAVSTMASLAQILDSGAFVQFWQAASQCRDLLNSVVGFDDAVREFIVRLLKSTFQHISKPYLASALDLNGEELNAFIAKNEWPVADDTVSFPLSKDNQAKQKELKSSIKFTRMSRF